MRSSLFKLSLIFGLLTEALSVQATPLDLDVTPAEAVRFLHAKGKQTLTFIGYSGKKYNDPDRMLEVAKKILLTKDPRKTIVNIGITGVGIGEVYQLAKSMGFETSGIGSVNAKKYPEEISPHCDNRLYISDPSWGGYMKGSTELSPPSRAMVDASDEIVAFGADEIGRDELMAADALRKKIRFIAFDMNHKLAIDKAAKANLAAPTHFEGAAHRVFGDCQFEKLAQ